MSTVVRISQDDDRLEAASRWALKIDAGLAPDDRQVLDRWLSEHPKNADALLEVVQAWDKLDSLARLSEMFPLVSAGPDQRPGVSQWQIRRRPLTWAAAAASLVLALAAALWLIPQAERENVAPVATAMPSADYETAIGEQSTVVLADGSEVVLNTNSRLSVSYSADARVISLHRGEILVTVAPDPGRPFSVYAGDRVLHALGTAFRVQISQDDRIELMVTEGKVRVDVHPAQPATQDETAASDASPAPAPILSESAAHIVVAGQELVLGVGEVPQAPVAVSPEEIEVKLSWRDGRLIFRGESLETALAELERYTTLEFVLVDEELKSRSVVGRFRIGDIEAFLLALRANFDIVHEYETPNRVLLSSL